jgi:hypothetical protein
LNVIKDCKEIIKYKNEDKEKFKKERAKILSNIFEEVIDSVYKFEMFTPQFCDKLFEEVENYEKNEKVLVRYSS